MNCSRFLRKLGNVEEKFCLFKNNSTTLFRFTQNYGEKSCYCRVTQSQTIEKFLGPDFKVVSSYGHVSDLPDKELGVDVEQNFLPKYTVSSDKKKIVSELKS